MTDSVNSRELVLAILLAVTKDGIYSHVAISDVPVSYTHLEEYQEIEGHFYPMNEREMIENSI